MNSSIDEEGGEGEEGEGKEEIREPNNSTPRERFTNIGGEGVEEQLLHLYS